MKYVMKPGAFEAALVMTDDAVARMGTFGVIGGGLLALASLMF